MIRIDMSEYMEKHSISRLVGAPPGYVGYEEGGQLTEQVRRHPYSVILFDEIEKAHPDVFNILLQILDDGHVTDSQGRRVDFKNTVIIMTSNLGAQLLINGLQADGEIKEEVRRSVMQELRAHFRPEFLNRVDDIILFKPLRLADITRIVGILTDQLRSRLAERDISLSISEGALALIAKGGYDPIYGARPLKRYIQKNLETPIARELIRGQVGEGGIIQVENQGNELVIHYEKS